MVSKRKAIIVMSVLISVILAGFLLRVLHKVLNGEGEQIYFSAKLIQWSYSGVFVLFGVLLLALVVVALH